MWKVGEIMKYDFEKKKYICTKCPSFIDFDEQSLYENICSSVENIKASEQNEELDELCEGNFCVIKEAITRAEKLGELFGIKEVE